MHIEPGVVVGAKIFLSYATAAAAAGLTVKAARDFICAAPAGAAGSAAAFGSLSRRAGRAVALAARAAICAALVFSFFEILPHYAAGVSEVHLILATALLLIFGLAPAALGLSLGLLAQGLLFEPADLPQYGMNLTTLLVPLFGCNMLAGRIIPPHCAYKNIRYRDALALSAAYQAGIVAWVAFWALYGQGVSAAAVAEVAHFGAAYMSIILVEPLLDLGLLSLAKAAPQAARLPLLFRARLYQPAEAAA